MPADIAFDQQRQWVIVRVTGELALADMLGVLRTARANPEHQMWPMLVDARGARSAITEADVDAAVGMVAEVLRKEGLRGHVALVADNDVLFSRLLLYEARTAHIGVRVIRTFRQMDDAEQWLRVMSTAWKLGDARRDLA